MAGEVAVAREEDQDGKGSADGEAKNLLVDLAGVARLVLLCHFLCFFLGRENVNRMDGCGGWIIRGDAWDRMDMDGEEGEKYIFRVCVKCAVLRKVVNCEQRGMERG